MLLVFLLALWLYWQVFGLWAPLVVAAVAAVGALAVWFKAANWRLRAWLALGLGVAGPLVWTMSRSPDWNSLALNFGTEMAGIAVAYFLIEKVIGQREKQEEVAREQQEKLKDLIGKMGSRAHDVAIAAAEELGRRGNFNDGTLAGANLGGVYLTGAKLVGARLGGANLTEANLAGARLYAANLVEANLIEANLTEANLTGAYLTGAKLILSHLTRAFLLSANLTEANLSGADLTGAYLMGAKLIDANLIQADLGEAKLIRANLIRADLSGANLSGANLTGAKLRRATLPDGTKWTPDTDMARFTDPKHPDYWRSVDPASPAYRPQTESQDS